MDIPLDRWSTIHAGSGFAMGVLGTPRPIAYLILIAWELFEIVAVWLGSDFFHESWIDFFLDLVIGAGAYELGRLTRG